MKTALICPVGTTPDGRTDILTALATDIRELMPDLVVFVVSRESRQNAERVAEEAGYTADACEYLELPSSHDFNHSFRMINEVIRGLRERGFSGSGISVNYTSGTKVMGGAALLASVYNQCREARYIYHEAGQANRTITTTLEAVYAFRALRFGKRLIEAMRYRSATEVLERVDPSLLAEYDVASLDALRAVASAYYAWDSFQYHDFIATYAAVPRDHEETQCFLVDEEVTGLVESLAQNSADGVITPLSCADMVNNAERRIHEGDFDDATARLYRSLEMLAQWSLREEGINPDDVDTRRVPPRHRVGFEALRSLEDGTVRLGMRKAYELLAALDHPVGLRFASHSELALLLGQRRASILAHGTRPISRESCEGIFRASMELFESAIPDFGPMCRRLQFPWIKKIC